MKTSTATQTLVNFSLITAQKGSTQKKIIAGDTGQPVRDVTHRLGITQGTIESIAADGLQGLAQVLSDIKPNQALALGTIDGDGPKEFVPKKALSDHPGKIARSKDHLNWPESIHPLLLDHDPEPGQTDLTALEFWTEVCEVLPEFNDAGRVVTISSSSAIYHQETGECLKPPSGHHTYVLVRGDVERFKSIVAERCWLKGKAFFKLATPNKQTGVPAVLERFLTDLTVFSPERLIYEAPPILDGTPFEQRRPAPQVFDGDVIDLDTIPDLSEDEQRQAKKNRADAREAIKPKQLDKTVEHIRLESPETDASDIKRIAKLRIKAAIKGELSPDHILYLADGSTITAKEVSESHDGMTCADPQEPDYHNGATDKARIYWNEGNWKINSMAHGGCLYHPQESAKPVIEKPEKTPYPSASKVAAELRSRFIGKLSFNTQSEQWLYYGHTKPGLWDIIPDAELEALIQAELDAWPGMEEGYSMGFVSSVVGLLRGRLNRFSWDEQPGMLPFENGVYDLQKGELLPHAPGYGFTWQLPRPYLTIETKFPKIDAWLDEATGGKADLKNVLLCWLNAVLKGRSDLQKFLHLVGPGGTGKGTFLRLATALIGEGNTHSSALDVLCQDKFEVANLVGKRLVTFSDEDKYSGRLGIFKSITGGDLLRAEQKHKTAYPFRFQGLAMVASNYPIFAGDTSSGLHRRVLLVPFTVQCPPEKRRNLEAEFDPELAALTTYLLSLDDEHVTKTLLGINGQSDEVTELTWEMRMRTDSLAAWLNDCVVKRSAADGYYEQVGSKIDGEGTLFSSYRQWCADTGSRPVGLREFSPRLLDLCQAVIGWKDVAKDRITSGAGKGQMIIRGLALRKPADDEPGPIDALISPGGEGTVKGEGTGEGTVKEAVKAGTLDIQGGEGCEGKTEVLSRETDSFSNDPSSLPIDEQKTNGEGKSVEKSGFDPSHPSPLGRARVSAFTPTFTHPSPAQPDPSPRRLREVRTGITAEYLRDDVDDGFIWVRNPDGTDSCVWDADWEEISQ